MDIIPQRTETITVDHFEHHGPIQVRPRTGMDSMIRIPSECDRVLGENMNPSAATRWNALAIAHARVLIVEPIDLVDRILSSENPKDLIVVVGRGKSRRQVNFFDQFYEEVNDWMEAQVKEAEGKQSGAEKPESGIKSAS